MAEARLPEWSSVAPALRRVGIGTAVAAATTTVASGAGSLAAAALFARVVLTPEKRRPDDTAIHEVRADTVVLSATPQTVVPGRYGMWLDGGRGHVKIGEIVAGGMADRSVERRLIAVDRGELAVGGGRWSSTFHVGAPDEALGLPTRHVAVATELGPMPAWLVPGRSVDRWAVLVHGRGATREEALRALPVVHAAGWTALVPTYRNDEGSPPGPDGRYTLGLSEWHDIEAAVAVAAEAGATEVAMLGWSMGGAITLQFLDRSPLAALVSRVVLDAPVVDWGAVLDYHASLHRLPRPVVALTRSMMEQRWGKSLVGIRESVDLARTDWVTRGDELRHRMLVLHSEDDDVVPIAPSRRLAERRPDLVTLEEWQVAKHCKEWNTETTRWETLVGEFLTRR